MIYLDYAATTQCDPEIWDAMSIISREGAGNPNSIHSYGERSAERLFESRKFFAEEFGLKAKQVIFLSGGTESDNLALWGAFRARPSMNHFVTTRIEHAAVAETCRALEREGASVTFLPVDSSGRVDIKSLYESITPKTNVVSIMHVNNEVGSIQLLVEAGKIIRERNKNTWFHTDAVQSFGKLKVPMSGAGIDMVSLCGHKIYGPLGTGVLLMSDRVKLKPIITGSGHEYGFRSGTENYIAIYGLYLAAKKVLKGAGSFLEGAELLKRKFMEGIASLPLKMLSPQDAVPYIVAIGSADIPGSIAARKLNELGIAVSSGAACGASKIEPSGVLLAMGYSRELAQGGIRFSFGARTTTDEIDGALKALRKIYG